ncbi:SAM-dependent methyltransferase 2 [Candidatus Rhodobacter oscarellae]|uniref:SAM-dependent methyltransferase 2 n=1 Tax=Candidatus Rhodobacter oscarellae TaxID=1675527 RepID=A0A0J9DZH7_9RHOB|nr:methyltransferase domain-containing protein [Candidatus Rhodobacter lobularis]KMW56091.1 SAM-dependent methyltransferase 2 [Candidatus Rhodobacter lobularis]
MHLDVLDLRNFYYRTGLGRAAQRVLREQVTRFWPEAKAQTVVGFGFAVPMLRPYLGQARRVVGLMPGPQGVMPWPAGQPNVSVLCEETLWPLQTGQADKLLVLHGLETSENPSRLLEECARVLAPGGRALFIVPNRRGMWLRRDKTPFGFGRPYSLGQLEAQLRRHGFVPERHRGALFQPPSERKFWLKLGPLIERNGQRLSSGIAGGVLMVEASKEAFIRPSGLVEAARRPMRILEGVTKPAAKPVAGFDVSSRLK